MLQDFPPPRSKISARNNCATFRLSLGLDSTPGTKGLWVSGGFVLSTAPLVPPVVAPDLVGQPVGGKGGWLFDGPTPLAMPRSGPAVVPEVWVGEAVVVIKQTKTTPATDPLRFQLRKRRRRRRRSLNPEPGTHPHTSKSCPSSLVARGLPPQRS